MRIPSNLDLFSYERDWWQRGFKKIGGIDEAGRGPLAGPVVAACVVFDKIQPIEGVFDSKFLTPSQREHLYELIISRCLAFGVGIVDNKTIDSINILNATMLAMKMAFDNLGKEVDCVFVDGNMKLSFPVPVLPIVKGDQKSFTVACASIIAKVTRDRIMNKLHEEFPQYFWDKNKGYPTKAHREAIKIFGYSPYHRMSYRCNLN